MPPDSNHRPSGEMTPGAAARHEVAKTRRDLPHWSRQGAIYWVTFRMADSLPQELLRRWVRSRDSWLAHHPKPWDSGTWAEHEQQFGEPLERWLDAGMGSRALARMDVREAVKSCLLRFNGERFRLHSAVIMPNHVHSLIEPFEGHNLSQLLKGLKGTSARLANRLLGQTGEPFWLDESFDHIVRSDAQYRHYLRYIARNPAKAKLRPDEYWLHVDSLTAELP